MVLPNLLSSAESEALCGAPFAEGFIEIIKRMGHPGGSCGHECPPRLPGAGGELEAAWCRAPPGSRTEMLSPAQLPYPCVGAGTGAATLPPQKGRSRQQSSSSSWRHSCPQAGFPWPCLPGASLAGHAVAGGQSSPPQPGQPAARPAAGPVLPRLPRLASAGIPPARSSALLGKAGPGELCQLRGWAWAAAL